MTDDSVPTRNSFPPPLRLTIPVLLLVSGLAAIVLNYLPFRQLDADLVVEHKLPAEVARQIQREALKATVAEGILFIIICDLLWFSLHVLVTRRANAVLAQSKTLAERTAPAAALQGPDELAAISRSLRQAHEQLNRQSDLLEAERKRFERMVEILPVMVLVIRAGVVEFSNSAAQQLIGSPSRALKGQPVDGLLLSADGSSWQDWAAAPTNPALERTLRGSTGEILDVESVASRFNDDQGEAVQLVIHDITLRKAAERAREHLTKELAEKNRELETLIYVASHDLRSPLVNIDGFSRVLEEHWSQVESSLAESPMSSHHLSPPMAQESLRFIRSGVARMDVLLEGLLRISRLGRAAVDTGHQDVHGQMSSLIRSLEFQLHEAGATVEVGPLPPCLGDRMMLDQVFGNVLDNALKYRDPNRLLHLSITGRVEDNTAIYRISDNGIGIAENHYSKIFEIFQRLDPENGAGQGLGLAIAQRCLTRLGGSITVKSKLGEGSVFEVSLPAAPLQPNHA